MALELTGLVELRTAWVGDHVETHAFIDGKPLRITVAALDALALLATGRPLPRGGAELLVQLGVLRDLSVAHAPEPMAARHAGRIALRPTLTLECTQPPMPSTVGAVQPEGSLPLGMFIPPDLLGPMQLLAAQLRRSWQQLWRAAIAREVSLDRRVATDTLAAIARAEVAASPALARAFVVEEPFRLAPRGPLQLDAPTFPISGFRIALDRAWRETGGAAEHHRLVDGGGGGHLASAGRLLGALAAGVDAAELPALIASLPEVRPLYEHLVVLDALGEAPAGPPRLTLEPGQIVHLGHAALLANLGGAHVLIDPWLPAASARDELRPPWVADLPRLDAILLTHHHWDHLHAETLLLLDKRVPIYVPRQDPSTPLWPRSEALLRYLGFADVRTLGHGEDLRLGAGGRIVAAAFTGEDPCALGWAGNIYVLAHEDAACLVHVDASPDRTGTSTVSAGTIRRLRAANGPMSPVFATRRQELAAMLDYGWEALLAPAAAWVEPTENCATGAAFLAALCRDAGASTLALYSEGGAAWYPPWTNFLAVPGQEALAAPYQHLWDPLEAIVAAVHEAGAETVTSKPYQRFRIGGSVDGEIAPA